MAAEKRVQQLNNALHNLQELYESQTRPANLVAIKKAGTLVYARPQEAGKPLFAAAAQDQFEMIEMKGEWIHVSISGESRGWIRKSQVEFLEDSGTTRESATDTVAKSTALFRMAREEVATFPGDWQPLRGKSVKIYSVQPAQSATSETSAREKREFVRELFLRTWKGQSSPEASSIEGVVVILDSVDGGQASVTLASLKQWQDGKISESAFWESCSLDPPETFSITGKK